MNIQVWTVLKALCAYYILQILIVHIYLFLNLRSIQGKPDPIINETVHRVTKTVIKNQTREYLTQEQIDRIEEEINAFEPIQKINYTDVMIQIQDNLSQIVAQRTQLEEDWNDIQQELKDFVEPSTSSKSESMEMMVPEVNQLLRLLKLETYVHESDVHIRALQRDIKEELSAIEPDQSYDFTNIFQVSNNSSFDCTSFLNRVRKVRGTFVTKEELDNYMDGLQEELKRVRKEPLSLNDKEIILNKCDFETAFYEARENIDNQILELMDTVDAWGDGMEDSCVTNDEVEDLIEAGMKALSSHEALHIAMQDALGDLDSGATLDKLFVVDDDGSDDADESRMTLRSLIETPLYPKVIEYIDGFADFIVGYNDFIDQLIDKMGQGHDGRVGRVFEKYVNRFCRRIQIPRQLETPK